MSREARVKSAHTASYTDPIIVTTGAVLTQSDRQEQWDGHTWLWATGPDGRAGWVPDSLIRSENEPATAAFDYSAQELTCTAGQILTVERETHDWAWCTDKAGQKGWVPRRNLASNDS